MQSCSHGDGTEVHSFISEKKEASFVITVMWRTCICSVQGVSGLHILLLTGDSGAHFKILKSHFLKTLSFNQKFLTAKFFFLHHCLL